MFNSKRGRAVPITVSASEVGTFTTQDMDYATLDRVIREAEDLGIRFIVVSGGEPMVRNIAGGGIEVPAVSGVPGGPALQS